MNDSYDIHHGTARDDSTSSIPLTQGFFGSERDTGEDQLYRLSENQGEDHELIRSLEHFSVLIFFWCLGLTVAVIALIL